MSTAVIPAPKKFVEKTDIVNNLTSTSTTQPLSAAQGKVLNEQITKIGDMVAKNVAMNTNTKMMITRSYQHQHFIIMPSSNADGQQGFIIASNGGVKNLGDYGSASWSNDNTVLTINVYGSTYRQIWIVSDETFTYTLST